MADSGLTQEPTFEEYVERPRRGLVGRFFQTAAQLAGLFYGWAYWFVQERRAQGRSGDLVVLCSRFYLFLGWLFVDKDLITRPIAAQFRVRFERMGPTYIKLGQILSLREDLLPKSLTDELKNLLSELPAVPFLRFRVLVEDDLGRPIEAMFAWVAPTPLGSASLAQTHRARLYSGDDVVLKVLKPGVRATVKTDTQLLRLFGRFLQFLPGSLSTETTDRRILPLHAAGSRSAQRSGQCRDFRCQLQRPARYPFSQDLPCVQQPRCAMYGVLRGETAERPGGRDADAC